MTNDISKLVIDLIKTKKSITTSEIVNRTGFSRAYIHRHLKELQDAERIILVGKADKAHYVLATAKTKELVVSQKKIFMHKYLIENLQEDKVWEQIIGGTGILFHVNDNIVRIVEYGFTEMLNNAIDHSMSKSVQIKMKREQNRIRFSVIDKGIGIFRNIKEKRNLKDEKEAIQDLLKGRQTTAPDKHSGEGIFFTSKVAERFIIKSSGKRLIFNNRIKDVTIDKTSIQKGTVVDFEVGLNSSTDITSIFRQYTGVGYEFEKTAVKVDLYKAGGSFISRSQARRLLTGLDSFKHIVLDFQNVSTIGQGFADEVFRVWKQNHPDASIDTKNTNENVEMMIEHVQG